IVPHILVPEEPTTGPQILVSLRPAIDGGKLVAQRPNIDASNTISSPTTTRDATLEKGLQVAREMLQQSRAR
ncbi:MAG: hypothetical protein MUF23_10135, partial [Pirellula sp.]|nr:hypothetical protein [Pirellula sp.]